jgi:hypothetical protein
MYRKLYNSTNKDGTAVQNAKLQALLGKGKNDRLLGTGSS